MAYVSSEKIRLYPSAYRGTKTNTTKYYNPEARLNTEYNITQLTDRLVDRDFVIGEASVQIASSTVTVVRFCIKGYIFEVEKSALNISANSDVWAKVKISPLNAQPAADNTQYAAWTLETLAGDTTLDDSDEFKGVEFSSTEPSVSTNEYKLQIYKGTSVCSNLKYETSHMFVRHDDGQDNIINDPISAVLAEVVDDSDIQDHCNAIQFFLKKTDYLTD